jgi:hypothetical protein
MVKRHDRSQTGHRVAGRVAAHPAPKKLTLALAHVRAAILVRFRDDRVFSRSAEPRPKGHWHGGQP